MTALLPPPWPRDQAQLASRRSWRSPRVLTVVVLLGGALALIAARYHQPATMPRLMPPCLIHELTHWHCPGCGMTRAVRALARGQLADALGHNAVGLLLLALTASVLARPAWRALRTDRWDAPRLPRHTAWALAIVGGLWGVLRNLPWPPFTSWAP
jgi:uncharacterized membrane protein YsdA (DUF1294 family)